MIPEIRKNLNVNLNFINSTLLHKILIGLCCFFITLIIIMNGALPEKYDLKADDISPVDFIAPRDIIDKYTTDKLKAEEENKIPLQYDIVKTTTARCQQKVSDLINQAIEIKKVTEISPEEKAAKLKNEAPVLLSDDDISTIIKIKNSDLTQVQSNLQNIFGQVMESGVEEGHVEEALLSIRQSLEKIEPSQELRDIAYHIASAVIEPNKILNEEETRLLKEKARNNVDARIYKQGEKIVGKGERLKPEHIAMLNELGIVRGTQGADYRFFIGSIVIVLLLYAVLVVYLYYFNNKLLNDRSDLILLGMIIVFTLVVTMLLLPVFNTVKEFSLYLLPLSVAPMLITILLDTKLAMLTGFFLSILVGIMTKGDISFVFVTLISSFCSSLTAHKAQQRNKLMLSGIVIGMINSLLIISLGFVNNNELNTVLIHSFHGMTNGVLSIIITIGILPFLEATFNIITPLKLLELSNPNQPLLKRLLLEAPGTYHHSLMVGNLAEAATEAIGGNALLARVAAYYHDIGKLKRPYFFKENQFNDNPHDRMTANLSTLVITSHTKDGEEIAKINKLPLVIRNIIKEHHGTTLVAYFYHKASQEDTGKLVDSEDFRYAGPKPQTKESAVVMLADCVEAVVRAIPDRTEGKVEGTVRKVIKEKLEDGQLDLCDLTLRDLDTIAKAFLQVLSGFFHERIQYPDIKLKDDIIVDSPEKHMERSTEDGNHRTDHREQSTNHQG